MNSLPTQFCDNCQRTVHPVRRKRVPTPPTPGGVAGLAARYPRGSADSVPVAHCCCHAPPLLPCFPAAGLCLRQWRLRQRRLPPAATATAAAATEPPSWRTHPRHLRHGPAGVRLGKLPALFPPTAPEWAQPSSARGLHDGVLRTSCPIRHRSGMYSQYPLIWHPCALCSPPCVSRNIFFDEGYFLSFAESGQ